MVRKVCEVASRDSPIRISPVTKPVLKSAVIGPVFTTFVITTVTSDETNEEQEERRQPHHSHEVSDMYSMFPGERKKACRKIL